MRCPRCKGENTDSTVVCSNCNLKLKSACPRCKSLNAIGQSTCTECNLKLIRFCPQCKTPNFPNVSHCRKCNFEILKTRKTQTEKIKEEIQNNTDFQEPAHHAVNSENQFVSTETTLPKPAEVHLSKFIKELSRTEAHDSIINLLKTSEQGLIINLSAQDGAGKSTLLSSVTQSLKDQKIIWLIGTCPATGQNLPYSFFQDLFKTLFGLPLFVSNIDESKSALNKISENDLNITDPNVSNIMGRILFNDFKECSPSILENRDEIHNVIYTVICALNQKADLAIIIEDFEYIDNASLDCIKYLLSLGFLDKKNFILINHLPEIDINNYFPLENLKKKVFSVELKSMTPEELNTSLLGMINNQDILPPKIKNTIFQYAKDVPLYMEQVLWYLFQTGAVISTENTVSFNPQAANIELPKNLDELIAARIKLISNVSPDSIKIMMSAGLFGNKFIPAFVQMLSQTEEKQFNQLIQMLINNGILAMVDNASLRFKHSRIWKVVYEKNFTEEQIMDFSARLLEVYEKYTTNTSRAVLAHHAEEAGLQKDLYIYYNRAVEESVCLGDPATFTENQNKILELLPESDLSEEQKAEHKLNIEEQIGRVNFEFNPELAEKYLSDSVLNAERQNNAVKVIDLTGYLARSCELSGNFAGVIECCDKALSLIDKAKYPLEVLLLNYYKLDSTFNMGRFEETIINATNEVLPGLNKYISKNKTIPGISKADIKNIEYETELTLAKAYVYQGNKKALDLTGTIALKAQKEDFVEFEVRALLLQSLFLTIQGNLKACNANLSTIKEKFESIENPDKLKLHWYFVAVISSMTTGNFRQAKDLCASSITLAEIYKEYNILTLLKLISGKCYEENNQPDEASALYDEVVNYCSENKMATGALYSWYMAANSEFKTGNPEKAVDIAERAVEIAQKPHISNYQAELLLHKLIAEVRILKGDFEGAQMSIESAVNIAENNDLILSLIGLYITFAKIYRESAIVNTANAANNINIANKLYTKALAFAEQIENHFMIAKSEKNILELQSLCNKFGIKLENTN